MDEFRYYHNIIEKARFMNTDKRARQFRNTIDRFFNEWKKQIIANLKRELKNQKVSKALGKKPNLSSIVHLTSKKIKSFINKLTAISTGAAKFGMKRGYKDVGVAVSFDINMSKVADRYKKKYTQLFESVLEKDIQVNIQDKIAAGVSRGDSVDDIAKEINTFFKNPITVPAKVDQAGKVLRAEQHLNQKSYSNLLARTEVSSAVNNGRLDSYADSGLVKTVKWFANPGACEYCESEKGNVYRVNEAQSLIPAHPNCMCTWVAEDYGDFKEDQDATVWSTADDIVVDPAGAHAVDWFKINASQEAEVTRLLDNGKYKEAIDKMNKFTQGGK